MRELLKRELWEMDLDSDAPNAEDDIERKRGMSRASLGLYTTQADLEKLIDAVRDLQGVKRSCRCTNPSVRTATATSTST